VSRNLTVALGIVLWTALAIVALAHAVLGDWLGPVLAFVIVALASSAWHLHRRIVKAS
jgi:hypothetical protein